MKLELESFKPIEKLLAFWVFERKISQPAYNDDDIFRDDRAWAYSTEKFWFNGIWLKSDRRKKLILGPLIQRALEMAKLRGKGHFTEG